MRENDLGNSDSPDQKLALRHCIPMTCVDWMGYQIEQLVNLPGSEEDRLLQ
jgi:hypothetical protein